MKKKKLLFFVLSTIAAISTYAQNNPTSTTVDLVEKTPTSPNAGSIGKYFDFPVNMASGTPSITIPLYTIETGKITLPITLSYNARGVKVGERASWVGTGWSLETGGTIIKKTNGFDDMYATATAPSGTSGPQFNYINPYYSDFIPGGFTALSDIVDSLQSSSYAYAHAEDLHKFFGRIAQGFVDGEADEYFFTTRQGSGTFFFNQKTGEFLSDKPDGLKIQFTSDSTFYLTTRDGLFYDFSIKERIVNPIYKKSLGSYMKYLTNTWHLAGIGDLANSRSVWFTYENRYSDEMVGRSMYKDYKFVGSTPTYFGGDITDIEREGDEYSVTAIFFREGKVLLVKDTAARLDGGTKALREVQVYNNRNKMVKRVRLNYTNIACDTSLYCNQTTYRLFLSSIGETEYSENGDSLIKEPYQFTYNTNHLLPCTFSIAQDYWGFYNGKKSNTTLLPTLPGLTSLGIPTQGNREVDTAYTQTGVLEKIKYPTGGITKFEYENNFSDTLIGGLRIKRITHTDSLAMKTLVTEYEYKDANGQSSGQVLFNPVHYYVYQHFAFGGDYPVYRLEGDAILPLFPNQGSPILYTTVLEKKTGSDGELRTRHYYTNFYSYTNDSYMNMCCGVPHNKQLVRADLIGLEYKTETYSKNIGSGYTLIQQDDISLQPLINEDRYVWNAQAAWAMVMDGWIVWPGNDPYSTNPINLNASVNAYKLQQQTLVQDSLYSTKFSTSGSIQTGSFINYDQNNGVVKELKAVDSRGDTTITLVRYSGEYIATGSFPGVNYEIKSLQENHMLAEPIETITLVKQKDSTKAVLSGATLYEYERLRIKKIYKVYDKIPFDSFTVSYNNSSGFFKDSRYTLYQEVTAIDSVCIKPLTVITNTNQSTFLWDSMYSRPIAVIANAAYEDVAYTSFEGYGTGRWNVSSGSRDSSFSITGRKSYSLSSGSISRSGLSSGTAYVVSYWSRNGSYTVSGSSSVVQGKTVDGWTYYEHPVTGVSTITISGSGSAYIDELRLYPKGAQVATYCYEELIGLTAQCDAANRITYYEYFGPGLLKLIRDQEKNILKRVEYKYQSPVQ